MKLDKEVNFNQTNGFWITPQGIIDYNFQYLFCKAVPKGFFPSNYHY